MKQKEILYLLGTAWLAIGMIGSYLVIDKVSARSSSNEYVTFDTVKFVSSRREMTTRLLGDSEQQKQEAISVLARVDKNTQVVLDKYAKGKIVIVKQALVLDNQVPDITDAVLEELGLPTNITSVAPQQPQKILTPYSASSQYSELSKEHEVIQTEVKKQNKAESDYFNEISDLKAKSEASKYLP